ncbi:bifunctional nuclease family protein [Spirochaetia bacterium 38H-sp]|uniref:Bifunctional nuclease family protein n=1 Tax=Rarispira pelagica TaxID=3141764 RepID=A0ABU9U974_9SPIR
MRNSDLKKADVWTVARTEGGTAVLLRPEGLDKVVPIFIGHLEAQSILIGLGNVPMPRPLTHDLFIKLLEVLDIKIKKVEINDLKEATYYARIILDNKGKIMDMDSRPSDAIAIAVRCGCPIYVADFIIEETSISISLMEKERFEPSPTELEISRLEEELNRALENERYEEAARIRDRIRELKNSRH